jgi:hypothetical protein
MPLADPAGLPAAAAAPAAADARPRGHHPAFAHAAPRPAVPMWRIGKYTARPWRKLLLESNA